jgi:polysaccharide biosynthesis protein PslH
MNFLWIIEFEYAGRLHHGALLRYFNFARELTAQGHTVVFAVNFLDADPGPGIEYFQQLRAQGVFSDFVDASIKPEVWRLRVAARLIHPRLASIALLSAQRAFADKIDAVARERQSEVIVISGSQALFLPLQSRSQHVFIYDLCDSQTLHYRRRFRAMLTERDFAGLRQALKPALFACTREHYYSRLPVMKLMVSPVDKEAIDRITGRPEMSAVVLNGVKNGALPGRFTKIPGRMVFSGNMDFPPNYEAALWFLDRVFPLVLSRRPDATFVIAGANPIQALKDRASKNVVLTGFVEDLNREIASSEIFVAPLVSGGGFKNKVAEAIINRTSVVSTSIGVEFFSSKIRELLATADSPAAMADAIQTIWENPVQAVAKVNKLYELVSAEFSWKARAAEVAELARRTISLSKASR